MRTAIFVILCFFCTVAQIFPAAAWSESDCIRACQLTARKDLIGFCINTKHRCSQYRGNSNAAPGEVNRFSAEYNRQKRLRDKKQQ